MSAVFQYKQGNILLNVRCGDASKDFDATIDTVAIVVRLVSA
jgi:hypothetical protein